jgi:uncharacterized protein
VLVGVLLAAALAFETPTAPAARVNDYAGLLSPADRQRLEQTIAERERAAGAQVAIAIFRSLDSVRLPGKGEPGSIEELSIWLGEKWRIGQKGLDNGVIVVVLVENRKMRLEVGYGLEGVIPDIVAGRIIADVIAPRFREQRYADGLEAAVQAIYRKVGDEPHGSVKGKPPTIDVTWRGLAFLGLFVVIVIILGMEMNRSRGVVARRSYTTGRRGDWAGPVILPGPGWGGGWSGGGGGGGFSGGGGSFGGGGASGGW